MEKVLFVWSGGYYLVEAGRKLFADGERTTRGRVVKQQGEYARVDGMRRRRQRLHNYGTTESLLTCQEQGYQVVSALGMTIIYRVNGRMVRVDPDGFVILPTGEVVPVEYERSARKWRAVIKKGRGYGRLREIGFPTPVYVITETEEAADFFAALQLRDLLAVLGQGTRGCRVPGAH